ncbi:WD40 repeat-like protein [Phanerochaete sordida]|uniref:WD40 repeat-like protein n=1 Tax=Phanerochaete sordida TaxID=48140 RepID=A0A9P3FXY3_9APHY|nr:WD40 repeat-like protein [Phanerochaete sordida]
MDHDERSIASPREAPIVLPRQEPESPGDGSAFYKFELQIIDLDLKLRQLSNAARKLGSSVGILSASFRLCERLSRVLFLFSENATVLFPHRVHQRRRELQVDRYWNFKRQRRYRRRNRLLNLVSRLSNGQDQQLTARDLPAELHALAADITRLLDCFGQYPEFLDEVPEQTLEEDIESWASYLSSFDGMVIFYSVTLQLSVSLDDIETAAVRKYVHDLSITLGYRLHHIASFIPRFIELGVPTIRGVQKGSAGNLINLSTVATLFSGVTATVLQFSYANNSTTSAEAVNGFWFISLVFSISAAVNSLLGLTWMQAVFRSPDHRIPWWVLMWIKRSPLVFLVLSVACFYLGLMIFAYSSQQVLILQLVFHSIPANTIDQSRVTAILTVVLSTSCCFGLAAMSMWIAFERWIYNHHDGNKLLSDFLSEAAGSFFNIRVVAWFLDQYRRLEPFNKRIVSRSTPVFRSAKRLLSSMLYTTEPVGESMPRRGTTSTLPTEARPDLEAQNGMGVSLSEQSDNPPLTVKDRFRQLAHRALAEERAKTADTARSRTNIRPGMRNSRRHHTELSDVSATVPSGIVSTLVPRLKNFEVVHKLDVHGGLVRDMQFSPDGKYLATASWDKTILVLDATDSFNAGRPLSHPAGLVGQLEWSSSGTMFLTKANETIRVWARDETNEFHKQFSIVRNASVSAIRWLPSGKAILSVEHDNVIQMDLKGTLISRYTIENMALSDVAITQDSRQMICVGTYQANSRASEEGSGIHQIILYNADTDKIEKRAPLFVGASDVVIASDDKSVLVSFEAKAPPQLWKLQLDDPAASLALRHTFTSPARSSFAALASVFGGENDGFVLRAETAGHIHIWDRDTATPLHFIHAPGSISQVTSLAWNTMANSLMFATGSLDGAVRIWTATAQEPRSPQSSSHRHTPTPGLDYQHTFLPSGFRRRGSSFGVGYRSESPTIGLTEEPDSAVFDDEPPMSQSSRSPGPIRRATTMS